MRNTFFTIPNSVLTGGVVDLLTPIRLEIEERIYNLLIDIQNRIQVNCGNLQNLKLLSISLDNLTSQLINFKDRLNTIKSDLNVEKEYKPDRSIINQKNEFLISTVNTNFETKISVEDLLEKISFLEEKILALDNELLACSSILLTEIPTSPPKSEETLLIDNNLFRVDLIKLFENIKKRDIQLISDTIFLDYFILDDYLNKSSKNKNFFSNRFYLDIEECSVAALIAGIKYGLPKQVLLDTLSLSDYTVKKYENQLSPTAFSRPNISLPVDSISTLKEETYIDSKGTSYRLAVIQDDKYKIGPVFTGVAYGPNNEIVFRTNETFSNSSSVLLNELKFRLKHNIS